MTKYERIFGAGPRGIGLSIALFIVVWQTKAAAGLPIILPSAIIRWAIFILSVIGSIALALWSARSLPPADRGKKLITEGAYRYFRHPLYATFLSCFNFGLAVLLNNWIYIIWAVLLHGVWHWNIRSEESLMRREFPGVYDEYCMRTGRFIPKCWSRNAR
jgi:protein-S-isoprenylcysteine O-methyltransferase Ste14